MLEACLNGVDACSTGELIALQIAVVATAMQFSKVQLSSATPFLAAMAATPPLTPTGDNSAADLCPRLSHAWLEKTSRNE